MTTLLQNLIPSCLQTERQREDAETPLAFRSALLALARAAYTSMDAAARDLLALECLLFLVRELGVALSVANEADSLVPQSGTRYSGTPQPSIVMAVTPRDEDHDYLVAFAARDQRGRGARG
ncbi:unnamed protein product [Lampetra fluviatilis]